jgi:hypothetical protein
VIPLAGGAACYAEDDSPLNKIVGPRADPYRSFHNRVPWTCARPRKFDESDVVAAARDEFWSRGYAVTSVDDLSAVTGLGKGSLYRAELLTARCSPSSRGSRRHSSSVAYSLRRCSSLAPSAS